MPKDAVVRAVQNSQPEEDASVLYMDLPKAERTIVDTAIEEDFYHACPKLPKAVRSFTHRVTESKTPYLGYQGKTYGLWVRVEDKVYSMTADPPEKTPSCGYL